MSKYILCALLGYFAGCFSPSYLLSRRRGFDIRTFGSGNAGATNMMLAAGLTPELVLPLLALMFIIGMIWNRASILPLLTALVYAPLYLLRTSDWRGTIALALIFPAMLWAHRSNFARWREGKEQTFRQFLFGRHEPQREEAGK